MAGPGFSEACRGRRMWITAQCSSTVLSRWLHLFWQALDCVWWWETAPGWRSAPALQLTMWIMETRRSKSMHQQTPTPINPSLRGSLQRPQTYLSVVCKHFKDDGGNGPECSIDWFSILDISCINWSKDSPLFKTIILIMGAEVINDEIKNKLTFRHA